MNSLDYDIHIRQQPDHIRQQPDARWFIVRAEGQAAIAVAANLDEAVDVAAGFAPGGRARVLRSTGKIAVLRLGQAAPKPQA